MTKTLKLPITNVYAKGDYCVSVHIGSEQSQVNLILDTGSSTLVIKDCSVKKKTEQSKKSTAKEVDSAKYQAQQDKNLTASAIVQGVNYGIGGWNGPVIYTNIHVHEHCPLSEHTHRTAAEPSVNLTNSPVALVASTKQQQTFGDADGMLGLAYHHLNKGFNLTDYFTEQKIMPEVSYPWPFTSEVSEDLKSFKNYCGNILNTTLHRILLN